MAKVYSGMWIHGRGMSKKVTGACVSDDRLLLELLLLTLPTDNSDLLIYFAWENGKPKLHTLPHQSLASGHTSACLSAPQRDPLFKTPHCPSLGPPPPPSLRDSSLTLVVSVMNEEEWQHPTPCHRPENSVEIFPLKQNLTSGTQHPVFVFLTLLPTKMVDFNTRSSRKMCKTEHKDIQIFILLTL